MHEKTKYFPFLPDKRTIKVEDFSPYMMKNKPEKYEPTEKLIMYQTNKQRSFQHYRDLKFYLRHGIRIVKVHTVYKFKQSPWLSRYIKYSTEQRSKAKTEFEKHFYKLMNNSFYGRTIENIGKRLNLDLIDKSDTHRILNRQSKRYLSMTKLQNMKNLVCIHLIRKVFNLQNLFMLGLVCQIYQNS